MEIWSDNGIVLRAFAHGEGGAIVTLLTENHGMSAGYLPGAGSKSMQGTWEIGTLVQAQWQARLEGQLGRLKLEPETSFSAPLLHDHVRLAALKSACALCRTSLPERESNPAQYRGLLALLNLLSHDNWAQAYIAWEIGFLNEHGCPLDLTRCAVSGDRDNLTHVSPKSGRAVSAAAAAPYLDKLLPLPSFLQVNETNPPPQNKQKQEDEIHQGLSLTKYFIEHWIYGQTTRPLPEERSGLQNLFATKPSDIASI